MLDRLGELEHRHAGHDERRDGGHRAFHGLDGATHRGELLVGLRPPELVDDVRAGLQPLEADGAAELERGLGPDAVADRNRPVDLLRHALEERGAVVGLVDDDHLARRLLAQVERGEHARKQEDRVASGAEEGARDPAVRVGGFAEVRDLPLDAGQVLEVGGRSEEERVDACVARAARRDAAGGRRSRTRPDAS